MQGMILFNVALMAMVSCPFFLLKSQIEGNDFRIKENIQNTPEVEICWFLNFLQLQEWEYGFFHIELVCLCALGEST